MVSFDGGDITVTPVAAEAQVVGRLSTNMVVGEMNVQ
jgi:hypothetical protein